MSLSRDASSGPCAWPVKATLSGMKSSAPLRPVRSFKILVSVFRSDDLSFQGQNVDVAFKIERTGDLSQEIEVKYVVKDLASEKNDDKTFTGSVCIGPGKSSATIRVPITNLFEILEDGLTQEATVILQSGNGYNVVAPATAAIKLK